MYTDGMSGHPRSLFHVLVVRELGSVLEFPLWWYSRGIWMVLEWAQEGLQFAWKEKALGLWARNLFTPMYGDRSWSGRALSVVMRIAVIITRSVSLLVQVWAYLVLLFVWVVLPLIGLLLLIRPIAIGFVSWLIG